jgi:WD40 repeat protein
MGDRSTTSGGSKAQGYTAFISYSHAVDGRLAPALQNALHRFAKPWYRLRALRVVRDQASLSANPALWPSIEKGLKDSEFFILLASPDAARSPWVQRETAYWRRHKPAAKLLVVVTDGEAVWDDAAGDFDWDRTTALPRSLAGAFDEEPRYIDLRWARTEEHLSLAHPRFREAVADLAAPMHRRAKDELVGEDVRQHKRTVWLARSAIASLTVLTLLAAGAAVLYAGQRNFARSETVRARRQTDLATSRLLAAEADARATSQPILSTLLSVAAYRTADTVEARGSLLRQMERRRDVQGFLVGHRDGIRGVAFSPDGRTLASGSGDKTVILWDVRRRTRLATLEGHTESVFQVAFSQDGHTLASGSGDKTVILWDVRRRTRLATLEGHTGQLYSLAFSQDGRTLASGSVDKTVILWDVRRRTRLATLKGHTEWVTSLAFHPDSRTLASVDRDLTVLFWDVASHTRRGPALHLGRKPEIGSVKEFPQVVYSPDGRTLAAGAGTSIQLWQVGRHPRMRLLRGRTPSLRGLAFGPDGRSLVSSSIAKAVDVWDVVRGTKVQTLTGHTAEVTSVAVSPDGHTVASASLDWTLVLWDLARRSRLGVGSDGIGPVIGVAFGADGRMLASADETAISLWDVARRARVGILREPGEAVGSFAFSPDGRTLASAGSKAVILWDVGMGARSGSLDGHSDDVLKVAFSPDGRMLASGGVDRRVILWDVASRTRLATMEGQVDEVESLAFSPDGGMLAFGSFDRVVVWDLAGGTKLATWKVVAEYVPSVAFSPDGRTLAAAVNFPDAVVFWDVERRTPLASLDAVASSVVFSPDGRLLVAAGDEAVTVWDVERRTQLASLDDVADFVTFSPDGRTLAAAGRDQTVIVRDFDVGSWQRHLCAIVGRDLTEEEWQGLLPEQPFQRTCN